MPVVTSLTAVRFQILESSINAGLKNILHFKTNKSFMASFSRRQTSEASFFITRIKLIHFQNAVGFYLPVNGIFCLLMWGFPHFIALDVILQSLGVTVRDAPSVVTRPRAHESVFESFLRFHVDGDMLKLAAREDERISSN